MSARRSAGRHLRVRDDVGTSSIGKEPGARLDVIRHWGRRGFWALSDQACFAATNFIVSVWLARILSRADYGLYALGSTVLLFVGAVSLGLFGEPISVFGSGKYKQRFGQYLGATLIGWAVSSGLGLLLFGLAAGMFVLTGRPETAEMTLIVGIVAPLVALLRTLRMGAYASTRPHLAAFASGLHIALVVAVIAFVPAERVSPSLGFLALGLGAVPATVVLAVSMRVSLPWDLDDGFLEEVYEDHIGFGRWSVGANLLLWVPGNVVYFLLSLWGGIEAAGILKALRTFTSPVMHAIYALTSILMPKLVAVRDHPEHRLVARTGTTIFVGLAVGYWMMIVLGGPSLLNWAYAGGYDRFTGYLAVLALGPVISSVVAVQGASLRSMERPRDVFVGNCVAAVATLTLGSLFIRHYPLGGAVATILGSTLATAGTLAVYGHKARKRR
jgi:O-antigen/teichoic acid export membrane protein